MQEQTKIKLEDGTVIPLQIVNLKTNKIKKFLEKHTGLRYGKGDYFAQTISMLETWKYAHGPDHELTEAVMSAAILVIGTGIAERTGGYTVFSENETKDFLVFVPHPEGAHAFMMNDILEKILDGDYDYTENIVPVKIVGNKISLDDMRQELKEAQNKENYELAAILRDKINRKEKTKNKSQGK